MDLKKILRTMRHAQMEQKENPKTGERMVPPSVKFAVWVALILVGGALLWVGAAQFASNGDAGGALDTGDDGSGAGGNNTTADGPGTATESDVIRTVPTPPVHADRVADV